MTPAPLSVTSASDIARAAVAVSPPEAKRSAFGTVVQWAGVGRGSTALVGTVARTEARFLTQRCKLDRKRFVRPVVGALSGAAWSASLPWAGVAAPNQARLSGRGHCRIVPA